MQTILDAAKTNNVYLRLIGSIAIRLHSESARAQVIPRALTDIDFVGYSKQSREIAALMQKLGYEGDDSFNTLHGSERLIFTGKNQLHVDIFLDVLTMSHNLDLRGRLELDFPTVPLTDLLMTKLQIAELNEKDVKDMICVLNDHELADTEIPEKVNVGRISKLCASDWGIYKTFTININRILVYLDRLGENEEMRKRVKAQCEALLSDIEDAPKSMKWKMRARVGEKKRWYQLPEESS